MSRIRHKNIKAKSLEVCFIPTKHKLAVGSGSDQDNDQHIHQSQVFFGGDFAKLYQFYFHLQTAKSHLIEACCCGYCIRKTSADVM